MVRQPLLAVHSVAKSFGAVAAVRDVSFPLYAGEVHALVGENGAGKSTIVKMLAGVHRPDTGTIELDGRPLELSAPADALAAGIAVIYQEPTLFPDLTVAENIVMGRQPLHLAAPGRPARDERAGQRLLRPPRRGHRPGPPGPRAVHRRPAARRDRQGAVAGRAGDRHGRADRGAVRRRGAAAVHRGARAARRGGAALLFISHRFEEITALCQRVTVMRDGAHVSTDPLADLTVDEIVRRMVGRPLDTLFPKRDVAPGEVLLRGRGPEPARACSPTCRSRCGPGRSSRWPGWSGPGAPRSCGRCSASTPATPARCACAGKRLRPGSPRAAMAAGMALVPEDRRQQGLVLDASIERNATATRLRPAGPVRAAVRRGRAARRRRVDGPAADQVRPPRRPGAAALRRQPAEGGAGQVAVDRSRGC